MRFRLPKPLHGWREFIGEVGIIVLGVLIALGAQQVVEDWRWGTELLEARQSLNAELADARFAAFERVAVHDCLKRQLDALDAMTETDPVPSNVDIGAIFVGLRPWSTSTWDVATASGVITHMSQDERNHYASLFGLVKPVAALHLLAFETSNDLLTLERHHRLTDTSRDRLQMDIARLRGLNAMLSMASQQFIDQTKSLHLQLDHEDQAALEQVHRDVRECPLASAISANTAAFNSR